MESQEHICDVKHRHRSKANVVLEHACQAGAGQWVTEPAASAGVDYIVV